MPDWFVDDHHKPADKWQTKREREITNSGGGGKRHKPFGTGSHGNGKK